MKKIIIILLLINSFNSNAQTKVAPQCPCTNEAKQSVILVTGEMQSTGEVRQVLGSKTILYSYKVKLFIKNNSTCNVKIDNVKIGANTVPILIDLTAGETSTEIAKQFRSKKIKPINDEESFDVEATIQVKFVNRVCRSKIKVPLTNYNSR